jgi:ion channel POLLUX/CASTOR
MARQKIYCIAAEDEYNGIIMKKHFSIKRFGYRFDTLISKGIKVLVALMLLGTLAIIIFDALMANMLAGNHMPGGLGRFLWDSFTRTLDPGTMSQDNEAGSIGYVLFMCLSTFGGIILMAMLTSVITANLSMRVDALKDGNPPVQEYGHTLVLGYDYKHVITVVQELVEANRNQRHRCVVVLMDRERHEIEDNIHASIDTGHTRVICRSGRIDDMARLRNAGITACKSVIILPRKDDAVTIKSILACNILLGGETGQGGAFITASIQDKINLDVARAAGGTRLEALYVNKTIARIIAQTACQPGLSGIFSEIFSFTGQELYFGDASKYTGRTLAQAALQMENACLAGVFSRGKPELNPPHSRKIETGDKLILLQEDDDAIAAPCAPQIAENAWMPVNRASEQAVRQILVIGCNPMLEDVLAELSKYMAAESLIRIAAPQIGKCPTASGAIQVQTTECDILDRTVLEALLAENPQAVIVLSDYSLDPDTADAKALVILLHMDSLLQGRGARPAIVSEMRDAANQSLAESTHVNDLVVGNNLIARLLTQVSENRDIASVFESLLSDEGSEIHIKPINRYVKPGVSVNMYTVAASALRYGELFIGYKTISAAGTPLIKLNPKKTDKITFGEHDSLVVLAENDA